MEKVQAVNELYFELFEIQKVMNKAKAVNDVLYKGYFDEYGGKNPCIMTEYEKASYLHSIVTDYIDKSCKAIQDMLGS